MVLTSIFRDLFRNRAHGKGSFLSVVVNFHNNRREARNTLHSLTREYQLDAQDIPYEVIALDHGSTQPLTEADVCSFGPQFQYRSVPTQSVSPVAAINEACHQAAGEQLLILIDGAHILTPGVLRLLREAFRRFQSPFVATVPFHLGPKRQNLSVEDGYNQMVEDQLLEGSGWKKNGYKLYSASGAFADDSGGWYGQLFESGCFALHKADYLALGGFDERFQSRGGGLTNLDIFQRALMWEKLNYIVLLGEGTFHQVHGGVATNAPMEQHPWNAFHEEFKQIRGMNFIRVPRKPTLLGNVPIEALHFARFSRELGEKIWRRYPAVE